ASSLGFAYLEGNGVSRNLERALALFRQAAEGGCQRGENQLGYHYLNGIGVPKDYELALHWLRRSAASGFAAALVNLVDAYLTGLGVPADNHQAASAEVARLIVRRDAELSCSVARRRQGRLARPHPQAGETGPRNACTCKHTRPWRRRL